MLTPESEGRWRDMKTMSLPCTCVSVYQCINVSVYQCISVSLNVWNMWNVWNRYCSGDLGVCVRESGE